MKGQRMSLLLWPITLPWRIFCVVLNVTARLAACFTGLILLTVGLILMATVVCFPVGIALAILGLLLLIRSIF